MQPDLQTIYRQFVAFSILLLCPLSSMALDEKHIYSIGVVPQFEARQILEIWQPLLEAISENSGVRLQLKTSPNITEFEKQFEAGEFDFAYMNPYHLIIANEKQGYLPLLRDTGRNLYGIIVVKKDSPLKTVKGLDGKTVAFPSPNALGAALIPRTEFRKKYKMKIYAMYAKSHDSVYLNVVLGQADAGGGIQKTLEKQPENIRNQLRTLYKTEKVPSHPFVAHPRVPKNIRKKVSTAFIALGKDKFGKELLGNIPIKEIGKTSLKEYRPLKRMGLDEFYIRQ